MCLYNFSFIKAKCLSAVVSRFNKTLIPVVFLTVCAYSCSQQSAIGNQNIINVPVNAQGTLESALLYLPKGYEKSIGHYPLIIYLNGKKQSDNIKDMLDDGLPATIAKGFYPATVLDNRIYRFIVFSPANNVSGNQQKMEYMLSYLVKQYRIDTAKIYVTGNAEAADDAYSYASTDNTLLQNKVAAVIAVNPSTLNVLKDKKTNTNNHYAIPVLTICDANDKKMMNELQNDSITKNLYSTAQFKLETIAHDNNSSIAETVFNPESRLSSSGINVYQWMLQNSKKPASNKPEQIISANCRGKKIYITKNPDNNVYIDGRSFNYNAGDTLVLTASQNPFDYFELAYFTKGTDSCPVVVINEGGRVVLERGFSFTGCRHVKVTGTGTADKYGFYISKDGEGVGISAQGRSSNIEMEHLEIYNKHYGVWLKQEAECDDSLQFPNWVLHDVSIHDNYIHRMAQEGMYLGSTDPNGFRTITCRGKTITPKPMRLGNIRIYNNIIDSTGRGGIQLSCADSGNNEIYNNTITHCGLELDGQQGNGIVIGGYTQANIHDNYVRTTFSAGIFSLGAGIINIYNNDVDSSGYLNGKGKGSSNIMVDTRPTNNPSPGKHNPVLTKFSIWNNNLGLNTDCSIRVFKTVDTYLPGNIICNNTGNIIVTDGVNWTKDCNNLKNKKP